MSMTKYGAKPDQTSKTASGNPGNFPPARKQAETLQEKLERENRKKKG